ncbi:helix-turn-helix domain-containing protein [Flavihumibacter stibioxidans]|uniref:Transposase n=1 Tax=Flavihumibacter stibioxidans TaxID=1834163 RepID=A0ABR7M832_9BACT|nr:helix-turn-helix domain-containing protein [Flavihumibacter stibioxidans]MBC6491102.1 transposase [Flavihumibacter stibioxidans]
MKQINCPKCKGDNIAKSGVVKGRQRYHCKSCNYYFTVLKEGKNIDPYYVIKALQLYIEGISLREIERILGISHVSVLNWVRKYNIKSPENYDYRPTYKVLSHAELIDFIKERESLRNSGCMITELGDKFMLIKWERFRKNTSR